ncbi:MAG: diaminopimelate epimerase [Limnochordaceae bacterium]|nr:diaminopimelate epimerase [Limnochordaceae bacterium]
MEFTKMHGLGNDYVYVSLLEHPEWEERVDWSALSRAASNRHTGVGSDGLILIAPAQAGGDFRMRIFNADGSEGEMCGNGIRCLGKYVYDHGFTQAESLQIETRAGMRQLRLQVQAEQVVAVDVEMGVPAPAAVCAQVDPTPARPLRPAAGGFSWWEVAEPRLPEAVLLIPVSMGNPHAVWFVPDVGQAPVKSAGPVLERHPAFPQRANIEFAHVRAGDPRQLDVRVWERGSGETQACGTGACAAVVAARVAGYTQEKVVTVHLPGGDLSIRWPGPGQVLWMSGPAVEVFTGRWQTGWLAAAGAFLHA